VPDAGHRSGAKGPDTRRGSFWSGTIAFGLVSIPVDLFVANRAGGIPLRMVDADGTPLSRRYFCSRDERLLEADEIVRGYELDDGRFVVVEDEELDALAPEKSREIDLKRFVPVEQIDPVFFNHAYFLAPQRGAGKAYRLLAASMEATRRAGIASFVMRGKEYLVAIIGERGLLRAETLRFADELRGPDAVGLPRLSPPAPAAQRRISKAINVLSDAKLDRGALCDQQRGRLAELIERKRERGIDVVAAPEQDAPEELESAEVIDLMQILKQSLGQTAATRPARSRRKGRARGAQQGRRRGPLEARSKEDLYTRAAELGIAGRSRMSKAELIAAIRDAR
jgi:DNA end-binding protein Ku